MKVEFCFRLSLPSIGMFSLKSTLTLCPKNKQTNARFLFRVDGRSGLGGPEFGPRVQVLRVDRVGLFLLAGTGGRCGGEVLLLEPGGTLHYHAAQFVGDGVFGGLLFGEILCCEHLAFLLLFQRALQFALLVEHAFAHLLVEHQLPVQVLAVHRVDAGIDELLRDDQPLRIGCHRLVATLLRRVVPVDRRHHSSTCSTVSTRDLIVGGAAAGSGGAVEVKLLRVLLDVRVSSPLAAGAL